MPDERAGADDLEHGGGRDRRRGGRAAAPRRARSVGRGVIAVGAVPEPTTLALAGLAWWLKLGGAPRLDSAEAVARAAGEVLVALVRQGLIPEDRAEALRVQNELACQIAEERERWGYWIYHDRTDRRTLRAGCGRSRGTALTTPEGREYAAWALREHQKALAGHGDRTLPPAAQRVFTKLLGRRRCGGVLRLPQAEQLALAVPASGALGLHTGGH